MAHRGEPRGETEQISLRGVVDLDHDTVDLVVQVVAMLLPQQAMIGDLVDRRESLHVFVRREAQLTDPGQRGGMARELGTPDDLAELIRPERQLARGGLGRVLLPQASGGGVAGVDERFVASGDGALVQSFESRRAHVHLAAHFDDGRHDSARWQSELVGNVGDRGHVGSDVFADLAVATSRRLHEDTVFVPDAHRESVELQLAHERRHLTVEPPGHTVGPRAQFAAVHCVVEAHHRDAVGDGRERRADRPTDLRGRRRGRLQLGMFGFERLQRADQVVVVGVADLGIVERVVSLVVVRDLDAQRIDAVGGTDLIGGSGRGFVGSARLLIGTESIIRSIRHGRSGAEGESGGVRLVADTGGRRRR